MAEVQEQTVGDTLNLESRTEVPQSASEHTFEPTGPDKAGFYWGTGRRKSAIARVRIKPGEGKFMVNGKEYDQYFRRKQDINAVTAPLKSVGKEKDLDVFVNATGGGITGQSGATVLGIARALRNLDPGLIDSLRDGGYLTRDSRMVERKKYGRRKARRSFQFSKR